MNSQSLTTRGFITVVLILQFVPLVLFPPSLLATLAEDTWLGLALAVMAFIAVIGLVVVGVRSLWPWYLLSFCHGFNIISRLLALWQNATAAPGAQPDPAYLPIAIVACLLSGLFLWYNELPDVRTRLARLSD